MPSKMIMGVGAVAIVGAVGFGGYKFGLIPGLAPKAAAAAAPAPAPVPAYVEVNTLTVRLADKDAEHYLRIAPVLQVDAADQDKVKERLAVVRDTIFTVVASKQAAELMTPDGNRKLKADLMEMLGKACPEKISGVYFDDYLVE